MRERETRGRDQQGGRDGEKEIVGRSVLMSDGDRLPNRPWVKTVLSAFITLILPTLLDLAKNVLIYKDYRDVEARARTRLATVPAAQMVEAAAPSHRQREGNSLCRTRTEPELHTSTLPARFLVSASGQQTSQG